MSERSWTRTFQSDGVTVHSYVDVGDQAWVYDGLRPLSQANVVHLPDRTHDVKSIKAWSKYAASEIDIGDFTLHRAATLPQTKKQEQEQTKTQTVPEPSSEPLHRFRYDIHPHVYDTRSKRPGAPQTIPRRIPPKVLPDETTGVARAIRNTARKNHESRKNIVAQIRLRDGTVMPAAYSPDSIDLESAPPRSAYSVPIKTVPLYIIRPKVGEFYVPDILRPVAFTAPGRIQRAKKANESEKRTKPVGPVYVPRRATVLPPFTEVATQESSEDVEGQKVSTPEPEHYSVADWTIPEPEPVSEAPTKIQSVKGDGKKLGKKARKAAAAAAKASQPLPATVEDVPDDPPEEDPFVDVVLNDNNDPDRFLKEASNTANGPDPDPDPDPFIDQVQEGPAAKDEEPNPFEAQEEENFATNEPNPFDIKEPRSPDKQAAQGDDGLVFETAQAQQSADHPVNPNYFMSGALPANPAPISAACYGQAPPGYDPHMHQGAPWLHHSNHYYPHAMHPENTYRGPPPGMSIPEPVTQPGYNNGPSPLPNEGDKDRTPKRSEVTARATPAYVYLPRNPYNVRGGKIHKAKKKNKETDEHLNDVWSGIPVSVATWRWPETWRKDSGTDA